MASLEERVEKIERRLARGRVLSLVKNIFYVVVIVGVVLWLYGLYVTSGEWRIEAEGAPYVGLKSPRVLHVGVPLKIYNPDGDVMAKMVYYRVYINGEYAGDGFIPYLDLPSGWSEHRVEVDIDLSKAGCGVAKALDSGENITITLQGYAMIDLKTFGGLTWKTITVPYNLTAAEVPPPSLDEETGAFIHLLLIACEKPGKIVDIIDSMGVTPPTRPGQGGLIGGQDSSGSSGSAGSEGSISVQLIFEDAGLGKREVVVVISNGSPDPVAVYRVSVNGVEVYSGSLRLGPGESRSLDTGQVYPVGTPVRVAVETSAGLVVESGVVG